MSLVAVFILCVCWRRLLLQGLVPVDGNVIAVSFPNWALARSLWHSPRLPLWNPLRSMGTPYLADPITSIAYPPLWLLSALPDFASFLRVWVVLHSLLCAGFLAALVYRWRKDAAAAAAAAALGAFNGFFMARVVFPHCFASQAWLPAILYAAEVGSPVGLGVCFAMQWLAGYPTFTILSVIAALGWSLRRGRAGLRTLAFGGGVALGLCAVQLLPFLEFLSLSSRGLEVSADFAGQFSVPPLELLKELFAPQWMWWAAGVAGDPAMETFYIGLPALALALWAARRGGRTERGLAAAGGLFLVLSLGRYLPGFAFLPFFHFFRSPSNWLLPASVAAALLASSGVSRLRSSRAKWAAAALITLDLALFAQPIKSAWFEPAFLTDLPFVAQVLQDSPRPTRVLHSLHLMRAWGRGHLEREEDYLLMRDYLAPSYGMAFGIEDAANYQTLRLATAERYRRRLGEGEPSNLLDWAGVSLVIDLEESARRVERPYLHLRRNLSAKPRVFALEGDGGKLSISRYLPGNVLAETDFDKPQTVVFSEMDYPGWRVSIDGVSATKMRFEDAFISTIVPAGRHEVRFRFNPWSVWAGLCVSLGTLGWLLLRARADMA